MKISMLKIEIPNDCPEKCPYQEDIQEFVFKSYCYTCPILMCKITKIVKKENFPNINAIAWFNFFRNGMVLSPDAYIMLMKSKQLYSSTSDIENT